MISRQTRHGHVLWTLLMGLLALCVHNANAQKRPPNYSQDDMPITSFNCRDKTVGGYYADPETDCQMFHVCVHLPDAGIQDFRFLCPNDTSFDQEHQICDDWYNIDCELSSAYYGDNFDLYRIGVNHEVKKPPVSHKGTPIPLGLSTTIKPYQSKKNQYSDEEDDYKHSGNDILRGSHSSNYFSNKNRNRDDLDDDYRTPTATPVQKQDLSAPSDIKKQKTLVRKLTGKRPVTQKPVIVAYTASQPPSTPQLVPTYSYNQNYNPNYSQNYNQTYHGNKVSIKSRGNINYNADSTRASPRVPTSTYTPNIFQKINNLTENEQQDNSQENAATPVFGDISKTYKNSYNLRHQPSSNSYRQQTSSRYVSSTPAAVAHTESVRLPSTEYLQNIAQSYQQPAALINNQLQDTGSRNTYSQQQTHYNQYSRQPSQPATTKSAVFASHNQYQQQYHKQQSPINVPQTAAPQVYYNPSTHYQSTDLYSYQTYTTSIPNNTAFDYYKYYQTSTPTIVTQRPHAYTASPAFNYYQQPTTTTPPKYDPYATFQKANEKYDDEEFLKTAPSSNLKPSDLNAIHNQKKQLYLNATLKAVYSVEQPKSAYVQQTAASSTPKAAQPTKTAAAFNTAAKPTTQYKPPVQGSLKPASSLNSTSNSHDYDYAYYDNAGSSEYDQLENLEEDFAKLKKVPKS